MRPDADSRREMLAVLDAWRQDPGRGEACCDAILAQLPARFRVVTVGDEHVAIADETGADLDPPLCAVYGPSTDAEHSFVEPLEIHYLAEVTAAVVRAVAPLTGPVGPLAVLDDAFPTLMRGSGRT